MPLDAVPTKERRTAATRQCNADVVRTAFNILSFAQEKYKTSEWRWIQRSLTDWKGGYCLMGAVLAAADKVSPNASSRGPWWLDYRDTAAVATATHYLARAVVSKRRDFSGEHSAGLDHNLVVNFNNTRRFADVMNVLEKTKSLAEADVMPR